MEPVGLRTLQQGHVLEGRTGREKWLNCVAEHRSIVCNLLGIDPPGDELPGLLVERGVGHVRDALERSDARGGIRIKYVNKITCLDNIVTTVRAPRGTR